MKTPHGVLGFWSKYPGSDGLISEHKAGRVRLVPLGGLGEIGMNCLAVEQHDGILVVDCGAGFPEDDRGVDVIHPDFAWLVAQGERVKGVFLTHGHEDHIGGLPYLLAELDVPVWGPPHALGLVRRRLAEHDFGPHEVDLREAHAGNVYEVGPFRVEPIRVAHSIVEASALCIETAMGRLLHTGDFNFDPDPPDGEPTDELRLEALGDAGVQLMLSDSTNIDVPERAGSERSVAECVERLVSAAEQRVVVAMFASNIQRLITFGEIAVRTGRKLCLLGRSLETQYAIATQIGRVHWRSDLLVAADRAQSLPRERLMVLAGGTQAERNSALKRLSVGVHPQLKLEAGDSVLLSSRVIPGNERAVIGMVNDLLRQGLHVHTRITEPGIHTSGHAGRSEQSRMLELVRPRCFVPVHGTLHHLLRHAELARSLGITETLVVENGTTFVCDGERVERDIEVAAGRIPIAYGGEPLEAGILQARTELARTGIVLISLALDTNNRLVAPPAVTSRGVPCVDESPDALRALAAEAARSVTNYRDGRGLGLSEFVRRTVRRKLEDLSGTRPNIEVTLLETH
ncbi:MAG TPA: ribonuclease J [Polyangiaceae bacterium]|nr:ribonuclease J [Polyangiaceae bacterium]